MYDSSVDPENRAPAPHADRSAHRGASDQFELRSVVVRYRNGPDRCTVYPRRESCCEHAEAWLSADADAFVSLDEMR